MLWRKRQKPNSMTACRAVVGLSMHCSKPAMAGSEFCAFHAGLLGPWADAVRPIPILRRAKKTSHPLC